MAPPRILVMILAGGAGGRLELLTDDRAKPAVPYAGNYRLIDFPLSNCRHAGLSDVWIVEQFHPVSLSDHLSNGRPWDLDRSTGGLLVLHPSLGHEGEGWHKGTADALFRYRRLIRDFDAAAVIVVSADAVYKLDYSEVVAEHLRTGAGVTMVTTEVQPEDASRYGVVQVDDSGRITDYAYKPESPKGNLVANEVFVFDPERMLTVLEELAPDADPEEGLADLGTALLPHLVQDGVARQFAFDGYWRDVGTVQSYWSSHMELLADQPPIELDAGDWPILTSGGRRGPAAVSEGAEVSRSLLSSGSSVAGSVQRSVLAGGVVVEAGAVVVDSVVLQDAVIRAGARVTRAVVDAHSVVGADAQVGESGDGEITLIGRAATVPDGAAVPAGGRFPQPEDEDGDGS
ncbi:MAG: sugar phosphate nucleotidyltransferase [Actinomycetota bacterium]|nr:sugar phosphate nucleotidyltransferase [Actinomycetota bacterium]